MTQMLPYILPLILGRTFDLNKMQVGVDIFPKEALDKKVVIPNFVSETHYKVVDNMVEARDFLNVEGSFSLNIKAGIFKAGASGEYLSDNYNRENTVEVAVKATYQTVTEQLPADAKPINTWQNFGSALGTHFVRSITYGGEMIGAVRLQCNNTKDKLKIKGAVEVGGKVEIFDLGIEAQGEYMTDVSKSVESTQINIFSSIPLASTPSDMDTFKKTIDAFPDDLKVFNEGKGVPLKMELWPLSVLNSTRPDLLRNRLLEASLEEFEKKFDDLLNTKTAISNWLKAMVKPLTEEQEKRIGELYDSVEKTLRIFFEVIGSLDMSKGTEQLIRADEAYGTGILGSFYKKYLLLRQEIAKDQGEWTYSRGNGITYVHWGRENCSEIAEQMSSGIAVGLSNSGGGADFLCLSESTNFGYPSPKQTDAAVVQDTVFQYPGDENSKLFCSTCRLGTRGSVNVFTGKLKCPDGWNYIYDGLLMSGSHGRKSTTFICLDKDADKAESIVSRKPVVPNWVLLSGKKNDGKGNSVLVPCVVCTK